jgi:hypothetical protein
MHLLLFSAWVNVHAANIECILCITFMCRGSVEYKDCCAIWMGVLKDHDCVLELFDQLGKVPPTVKPLSRICNLSCLKCGEMERIRKVELIFDLLLGKFDPPDHLANEIRDVDRSPEPLLLDRLLILRKPHMLAVLVGVEYCLILYHQYMFLFPSLKHWWDALECCIIIACHQTDQCIAQSAHFEH